MELKQGLFRIPAKEYHALPGLSYTGVKDFLKSPAHYKAALEGEREETAAMAFGSAYHAFLLESAAFADLYAVRPAEMSGRSKDGQAFQAQVEELGQQVISNEDMEKINAMANVLWAHPQWKEVSPSSEREIALVWYEKDLDIWCRTRIDLINTVSNVIVDLKTTQDATWREFSKSAYKWGYHIQVAWTFRGLKEVTGADHGIFRFIAQEKQAPYAVGVYEASQSMIDYGKYHIDKALPYYSECLHKDEWPGYDNVVQQITLPTWATTEEEEEVF